MTRTPTGLPQVIDETVNGSVTRTYAYGLSRISENQLIGGTWTSSFYGYDGHGNVRFLANGGGAVTDTYQFDAFGNQIASTGATPNTFPYSGEQVDNNVGGFYQLRARWYRPSNGRFLTMDPIEHTSCYGGQCSSLLFNQYLYANADPVDWIDPTGQQVAIGRAAIHTGVILATRAAIAYYAFRLI